MTRGKTAGKAAGVRMTPTRTGTRFRYLWMATGATNLADGIVQISLPLLATRITESPGAVAGVGAALTLPWLLFALPVGALADRLDRRLMMLGANGLRVFAVALLATLVAVEAMALPVLYLAAFAMGLAEVVADTSAQAILPAIVPARRLDRSNARLFGTQTLMNRFVGPPLAGVLAGVSLALALSTGAWLYLAALPLLVLMRGTFRPQVTGRLRLRRDVGDGLRFLWDHRLLRTLGIIVLVMNTGWGAWLSIIVLFAVEPGPMNLSSGGYGLLLAAMGIGGLIGTLIAVPIQQLIGSRWAICADILGTVTMLGIPALTANLWVIGGSIIIGGAGATMWGVVVTSIRQQAVPDALLGRVGSAFRLFGYSGSTLGALVAGVIAELAGLRPVFATTAALSLLLLIPFFTIVTNEALAAARSGSRP